VNSGFADRGLTTWLPRRMNARPFTERLFYLARLSLPIL
jgi:hypothetical protein